MASAPPLGNPLARKVFTISGFHVVAMVQHTIDWEALHIFYINFSFGLQRKEARIISELRRSVVIALSSGKKSTVLNHLNHPFLKLGHIRLKIKWCSNWKVS